jgi:putative copper export protein
MNGSWAHLLHLIAFGFVGATLIPGIILNRALIAEKDPSRKIAIGATMRKFSAFAPFNIILLILTGIGNIYNRYLGAPSAWYEEGWLVLKLCLFAAIVLNALFVAPALGKGRMGLIKQMAEGKAGGRAAEQLQRLDRKSTILFIIQTTLVLGILWLSVFGSGKHPGVF